MNAKDTAAAKNAVTRWQEYFELVKRVEKDWKSIPLLPTVSRELQAACRVLTQLAERLEGGTHGDAAGKALASQIEAPSGSVQNEAPPRPTPLLPQTTPSVSASTSNNKRPHSPNGDPHSSVAATKSDKRRRVPYQVPGTTLSPLHLPPDRPSTPRQCRNCFGWLSNRNALFNHLPGCSEAERINRQTQPRASFTLTAPGHSATRSFTRNDSRLALHSQHRRDYNANRASGNLANNNSCQSPNRRNRLSSVSRSTLTKTPVVQPAEDSDLYGPSIYESATEKARAMKEKASRTTEQGTDDSVNVANTGSSSVATIDAGEGASWISDLTLRPRASIQNGFQGRKSNHSFSSSRAAQGTTSSFTSSHRSRTELTVPPQPTRRDSILGSGKNHTAVQDRGVANSSASFQPLRRTATWSTFGSRQSIENAPQCRGVMNPSASSQGTIVGSTSSQQPANKVEQSKTKSKASTSTQPSQPLSNNVGIGRGGSIPVGVAAMTTAPGLSTVSRFNLPPSPKLKLSDPPLSTPRSDVIVIPDDDEEMHDLSIENVRFVLKEGGIKGGYVSCNENRLCANSSLLRELLKFKASGRLNDPNDQLIGHTRMKGISIKIIYWDVLLKEYAKQGNDLATEIVSWKQTQYWLAISRFTNFLTSGEISFKKDEISMWVVFWPLVVGIFLGALVESYLHKLIGFRAQQVSASSIQWMQKYIPLVPGSDGLFNPEELPAPPKPLTASEYYQIMKDGGYLNNFDRFRE